MVGQIDNSILVGRRRIVNLQLVVIGKRVSYGNRQVTGITLLAIFAEITQLQTLPGAFFACPDALIEPANSPMQMIFAVILRERIRHTVQGELSLADAISIAPDQRAEIWRRRLLDIAIQAVEAGYDIAHV